MTSSLLSGSVASNVNGVAFGKIFDLFKMKLLCLVNMLVGLFVKNNTGKIKSSEIDDQSIRNMEENNKENEEESSNSDIHTESSLESDEHGNLEIKNRVVQKIQRSLLQEYNGIDEFYEDVGDGTGGVVVPFYISEDVSYKFLIKIDPVKCKTEELTVERFLKAFKKFYEKTLTKLKELNSLEKSNKFYLSVDENNNTVTLTPKENFKLKVGFGELKSDVSKIVYSIGFHDDFRIYLKDGKCLKEELYEQGELQAKQVLYEKDELSYYKNKKIPPYEKERLNHYSKKEKLYGKSKINRFKKELRSKMQQVQEKSEINWNEYENSFFYKAVSSMRDKILKDKNSATLDIFSGSNMPHLRFNQADE